MPPGSLLEGTTWCPDSRAGAGLVWPTASRMAGSACAQHGGLLLPTEGRDGWSTEHGSTWFKAAVQQHADKVA